MSDDVKAEDGQEPSKPSQPQAGQTAPEPAPPAGGRLDADKLTKELEDARKEAAKYRTERKTLAEQLEQFKAELDKLQTAQLSEQEKKDKEYQRAQQQAAEMAAKLAEAEKRNQELQFRSVVQATAPAVGIQPKAIETAYLLLDKAQLNDDTGNVDPKKVERALRELVKEHTYLLGTPTTSVANPSKSQSSAGDPQAREAALRARIYGRPASIFDAAAARQRGGGVVAHNEE